MKKCTAPRVENIFSGDILKKRIISFISETPGQCENVHTFDLKKHSTNKLTN